MQPIFFCLILAIVALAPARAGAADSTDGSLDYSVAAWDRNSGLPTGGITALMAAADGSICRRLAQDAPDVETGGRERPNRVRSAAGLQRRSRV